MLRNLKGDVTFPFLTAFSTREVSYAPTSLLLAASFGWVARPEKAGGGGSIPSLATISIHHPPSIRIPFTGIILNPRQDGLAA
jgi:hypothetical protein